MSSPPSSNDPTSPQPFEPGRSVTTPSGASARIVEVYPAEGEVLVQWPNGDRARFRTKHVKGQP